MKRILFIISMLALITGMNAQTASQARKLLDKTAAVVGNKGGASASFSMNGKYGNAGGTIIIKGKKFCARTSQAVTWFDGKTQWTYMKSTEEVNISTPNEAQQQAMNPYQFINMYKSGFSMTSQKAGNGYKIHLKAQNSKRSIKEMYITINSAYQPTQVKMLDAKGWTTINISKFKAGNYPDTTFRFNAKEYPNAEVIDLR